ncbi:MAG: hypothetical protein HY820_00415 [Acidobacteria bacterium]|nr:hypothetical protein [Acidobacteriota bacterium]
MHQRKVHRRGILRSFAAVGGVLAWPLAAQTPTFELRVRDDFGAKGDGLTDDTAAILQAGRSVRAGAHLIFGPGTYLTSQPIVIGDGTPMTNSTLNYVRISGAGAGSFDEELSAVGGSTVIRRIRTLGGPMIRFSGPMAGVHVEGLFLDCDSLADVGLHLQHVNNSRAVGIDVRYPRQFGFVMESSSRDHPGMATGCADNTLSRVRASVKAANAYGFAVGADNITGRFGCSRNKLEQASVLGVNAGNGFLLRYCDYITFDMPSTILCARSFHCLGVRREEGSFQTMYPAGIFLRSPAFNSIPTSENWDPRPNAGVLFHDYHREWNGGDPNNDNSYIPLFPRINGMSGWDSLGNSYNVKGITPR